MSLFFTDSERKAVTAARGDEPLRSFCWALVSRAERRAASPGLSGRRDTADWWHLAAEYLTDAAMARAILVQPSPPLEAWLRDATLSIARRPVDDWIGPPFRNHALTPPVGHLETAHLTWALAVVLDLAEDLFTESERKEICTALREKGLALCQRWLDANNHLANWRCVLNAGVAVAAAVLDDKAALARASAEFSRCVDIFQSDGSYGESLQYGNYAAYTLMLAREAMVRHDSTLEVSLPLTPYALKPRWDAASLFYQKPLSGWGAYPRPRSANFNDSAALYRASGDFLLHVAVRARGSHPTAAGLARWLFDTLYSPGLEQPPHDLASFGFVNDFGFLTTPLLPQAAQALPPEAAGLSLLESFSCGDVLVRDGWQGRTVLAIHAAGDPLHGPGHLHGDVNSFILVHNRERLLLDPGHSCYRNLIHDIEGSSLTHNTCTFSVETTPSLHLQESLLEGRILQQSRTARRVFDPKTGLAAPPIPRGGRRLLVARSGEVSVIGSEIASLYGAPLSEFTRFWFLCGSHVLFVVDRIRADSPIKTSWSWLLNNRDDQLNLDIIRPHQLVAHRGQAGLKLFHLGGGEFLEPLHAYVHDAYHPRPGQLGEGKPGSGQLVRWKEKTPIADRLVVHAIALDDPGAVAGWHLEEEEGFLAVLANPSRRQRWKLAANGPSFLLRDSAKNRQYDVIRNPDDSWKLEIL
jgi:hypothetical protein